MLEIQKITKTFHPGTPDERIALQDISLTVQTGDFFSTPSAEPFRWTADGSCWTERTSRGRRRTSAAGLSGSCSRIP